MKETVLSNADSSEDHDLIRSFCAGEKAAFDKLVNRHKDRIYNLCYWFLGDFQEADDMAQDIFIKAFGSLDKFRFESAFSTWIYRIAVNTCKNRIKSMEYRYKKWMDRLDAGPENGNPVNIVIENNVNSPQEALEKKEQTATIRKAINSLPPDKKTVAVLRDIEGLSYEEIEKITGLNSGTVKSKLSRARMDLKKKLKGVLK
ncbi:MAG: sigma-70 family RNA polymerase sigma factor [Desulfobacterales bacterium]|nr:sigma-70 family RNA polymerase sigma factor [Desulfobacterales bacterium]